MTVRSVLLPWLLSLGCAESSPRGGGPTPDATQPQVTAVPIAADDRPPTDNVDPGILPVATDIDETLTVSNDEWDAQVDDPTHDPVMRPDADTLLRGYAGLGYRIVYITARYEGFELLDGRSATEATVDWLVAHDF